MVYCTVCENWFHHGQPKSCIGNLTAKQAAALATDAPFICEYCEIDRQKKKDTPHTSVVTVSTDLTYTTTFTNQRRAEF